MWVMSSYSDYDFGTPNYYWKELASTNKQKYTGQCIFNIHPWKYITKEGLYFWQHYNIIQIRNLHYKLLGSRLQ